MDIRPAEQVIRAKHISRIDIPSWTRGSYGLGSLVGGFLSGLFSYGGGYYVNSPFALSSLLCFEVEVVMERGNVWVSLSLVLTLLSDKLLPLTGRL